MMEIFASTLETVRRFFGPAPSRRRPSAARARPWLEPLEDRALLAGVRLLWINPMTSGGPEWSRPANWANLDAGFAQKVPEKDDILIFNPGQPAGMAEGKNTA